MTRPIITEIGRSQRATHTRYIPDIRMEGGLQHRTLQPSFHYKWCGREEDGAEEVAREKKRVLRYIASIIREHTARSGLTLGVGEGRHAESSWINSD